MKRQIFIAIVFLTVILSACVSKEKKYFEKKLSFPENLTSIQKVKLAAYLVPTPQQLEWQKMELTAFIHFGINTFTGNEWGDGKEDPALFNPTDFDAEQWVSTLKESGFKMLIITAKHHDGFCLWQTNTTTHSVVSSPWRDGQGDVVREVKNACDKHGLKFGVYLSPWDRNAESYGDSPRYNDLFVAQLKELLTNYGEVNEVWFDGANGEGANGKVQEYDWPRFYHVIDSLQPKAVKAIMGDDVRWVGNESGLGRATEWSVTPLNPDINATIKGQNERLGISATSEDLGSRKLIGEAKTLYWYPSEVDVSIRPGWFYHPQQDHEVKTVQQLVDIYYQSVGMNSVLLLNIPPDTRGKLHEIDVQRLKQFGEYISHTFEKSKMTDTNTSWRAKAGDYKESDIKAGEIINTVMLQEDISKGQRVEVFKVEGLINDAWTKLSEGTTIGYKRLLRFDDCKPTKIRVTITETREAANIATVGAYYAPVIEDIPLELNQSDVKNDLWKVTNANPLVIDLGETISMRGFTYKPLADRESVFTYVLSVSRDGVSWKKIKKGEFSNIKNNPIVQRIEFEQNMDARYIQFETITGAEGGKPSVEMNQIGILTK